jgi:hypothetical protein
MIALTQTTTD